MVLIFISLTINDIEHFFICLLAICISSVKKCLLPGTDLSQGAPPPSLSLGPDLLKKDEFKRERNMYSVNDIVSLFMKYISAQSCKQTPTYGGNKVVNMFVLYT